MLGGEGKRESSLPTVFTSRKGLSVDQWIVQARKDNFTVGIQVCEDKEFAEELRTHVESIKSFEGWKVEVATEAVAGMLWI